MMIMQTITMYFMSFFRLYLIGVFFLSISSNNQLYLLHKRYFSIRTYFALFESSFQIFLSVCRCIFIKLIFGKFCFSDLFYLYLGNCELVSQLPNLFSANQFYASPCSARYRTYNTSSKSISTCSLSKTISVSRHSSLISDQMSPYSSSVISLPSLS